MSLLNPNVNLGVNELWYVAYRDYKPYTDRLRSTNTSEFTRDTTLDRVIDIFDKDNTLDKKSGS
jgi:hypothetical protein